MNHLMFSPGDMETLTERLIDDGWEFSIAWRDKQYEILLWKPYWTTGDIHQSIAFPYGKGATLKEAYDNLSGTGIDVAIVDVAGAESPQ